MKQRFYGLVLAFLMLNVPSCTPTNVSLSSIAAEPVADISVAGPYFDKAAMEPIRQMILSAKEDVVIEMYGFTNYRPIIDAIKNCVKRGLRVRIIVDNQDSNNPNKYNKRKELVGFPEKELEFNNCEVRWENSGKTFHRKICVVDKKIFSWGSTNWTENGFLQNYEDDLIITNADLACKIYAQFELDWPKMSPRFNRK